MSLVLSIDVGTTNLKAGVVNTKGEFLALRRVRSPIIRPEQGAAEHDPAELWELIVAVAKDVSVKFKNEISKVVISTYQLGLIFTDSNIQPLSGITLLSDLRARETIEELKGLFNIASLYQRTGCPPMFQYPFARLYYFKTRHPEIFNKASYFLSSKDYLLYQFTGEVLTEPSIAAATQLFDINKFCWDQEALSFLGISDHQLPEIIDGTRTALPILDSVRKEIGLTSTKVEILPGVYDGGALAVGLSGLEEEVGVMNIGTSALLRVPGKTPFFDLSSNMRLQPYCITKDIYLNGGALNNAALPMNWIKDKVAPVDFDDVPALGEKKGPPLFCLPYLTGERDAVIGPFASGVFFGLRDYHSKRDMVRSIMEGVAFSLCMVKESLGEGENIFKELRIGGGGAVSKVWPQIFADVFNAPITRPDGEETALVGNAMLAYVAFGVFNSLKEASENMVRVKDSVHPIQSNVAVYSELYEFFKYLRESMGPLYVKHTEIKANRF